MPNFTTSTMKQFADAPECERKFAPELRPHELIHNAIAEKASGGVHVVERDQGDQEEVEGVAAQEEGQQGEEEGAAEEAPGQEEEEAQLKRHVWSMKDAESPCLA